jgi:hypothetical protein
MAPTTVVMAVAFVIGFAVAGLVGSFVFAAAAAGLMILLVLRPRTGGNTPDGEDVEARVVEALRLTGFPDHGSSLSSTERAWPFDEFLGLVGGEESLQRLAYGNPSDNNNDLGALMATDARVIWARRSAIGLRLQTEYRDLFYEDIVAAIPRPGRIGVMGQIIVTATGNRSVGLHTKNLAIPSMCAFIEERMRAARLRHNNPIQVAVVGAPALSALQPADLAAQLERLSDLHREGVLTDEEFLAAKQHVLA